MICWFLLVPAGVPVRVSLILSSLVPVLVSLLLSSFLPQEEVLFHHDLLVPLGSSLGSGACLPSSLDFLSSGKRFCSIMICWFLLVPAGVLVLVFLLLSSFFPQEEVLFHHDLLVPLGSRWGSGACLPSSLFFDSGACLPSSLIFLSSGKGLGVLFHHDLLVLPGSGWGSGACLPYSLFFGSGACLPSFLFFLSSGKGFCSIMICWLLLVRVGFRCLSPFFSLLWCRCLSPFFSRLSFLRTGVLSHHVLLVPLGSGLGSGACLPSSLFFFPQERVSVPS